MPETDGDGRGTTQRAWLKVQSQVRWRKCWRESETDWEVSLGRVTGEKDKGWKTMEKKTHRRGTKQKRSEM